MVVWYSVASLADFVIANDVFYWQVSPLKTPVLCRNGDHMSVGVHSQVQNCIYHYGCIGMYTEYLDIPDTWLNQSLWCLHSLSFISLNLFVPLKSFHLFGFDHYVLLATSIRISASEHTNAPWTNYRIDCFFCLLGLFAIATHGSRMVWYSYLMVFWQI